MTNRAKFIGGATFGLLFSAFPTITVGKKSEESLPITKEEFEQWIIGTEWYTKEIRNGNEVYVVRRFYPNGVMKFITGLKKWKKDEAVESSGYKIRDYNEFQYGYFGWIVKMDKDFEEYNGKSRLANGKTKGKFVSRFDINE
jgi:hypothetical protein